MSQHKTEAYETLASVDTNANIAYNSFTPVTGETASKKGRNGFKCSTFVKWVILSLLGVALCVCLVFLFVETFKLKSHVASLKEENLSLERSFVEHVKEMNVVLQTPAPPPSCEPQPCNGSGSLQPPLSPCSGPGWRLVVDLDMTDSSQDCPSPWTETLTPARSCERSTSAAGCEGVSFAVSGGQYTHVCGRAVGYTSRYPASPDAFADHIFTTVISSHIDTPYLDGVSVTYGSPRQHIWSLAAGHGPVPGYPGFYRCPCDTANRTNAPLPPSFVGDDYFCDGVYNGALWDAANCTTACCTFNSPPYFIRTLPTPTSDDIEVRICTDESMGNEPISVAELQLLVQ